VNETRAERTVRVLVPRSSDSDAKSILQFAFRTPPPWAVDLPRPTTIVPPSLLRKQSHHLIITHWHIDGLCPASACSSKRFLLHGEGPSGQRPVGENLTGDIPGRPRRPGQTTEKLTAQHKGLFGKQRIQVDGRGLKGILGNFDL
jgi:hypothetical protein